MSIHYYLSLPYTIVISYDKHSHSLFIKIKELQGCMSVASNLSNALYMINEAKLVWLMAAIQDGVDIPLPESIKD